MTANIEKVFKVLGLKEPEIKVFFACLENKDGLRIGEIVAQTNIRRSTVNLVIERLLKRGFLSYYLEGQRKVFTAEPPALLLSNLESSLREFKDLLPLLQSANSQARKTKVRFFEGVEEVEQIFNDILLTMRICKDDKVILSISSGKDILAALPQHQKQFINRRVKERISVRWIAPDDQPSRRFLATAKQELRQMKFVDPKKYPIHLDINIYEYKISFLSFESKTGAKPAGVIIENENLASSFRSLFTLLWDLL